MPSGNLVNYLVNVPRRGHLQHLLLLVVAQRHRHQLHRVDSLGFVGWEEGPFTLVLVWFSYCLLTADFFVLTCCLSRE